MEGRAVKRVNVEVTAEDIAQGVAADCQRCPVALALKRATGEDWRVGSYEAEKVAIRVPLPMRVRAWTLALDTGEPVEPFSFEIEVPE